MDDTRPNNVADLRQFILGHIELDLRHVSQASGRKQDEVFILVQQLIQRIHTGLSNIS